MSVPIALTLLVLCTAKVHRGQGSPACPRKEPPPGVLALSVGSEVILGCRGDVTVNGVLLEMGTNLKDKLERRGAVTRNWKSQKGTTGIHHPESENLATQEKLKMKPAIGDFVNISDPIVTATPTVSSVKEKTRGGQVLQAVSQATKPSSVARVTEGWAFNVTTEMGMSSERRTITEYDEDEDYDEELEGSRVTRSIKRQARWTRNGRVMRNGMDSGGILRLPDLQLTDSGNYSCYRRDKLVSSVKISVGIPPVNPTLSCHKKSHSSKIRCEWISKQPIVPQPKCYLLYRRGLEMASRVNCSYSVTHSRCWCALMSDGNDRQPNTTKLCVTNTVGSATSSLYTYNPKKIIKPDPPSQVTVKPVTGEPHTLKVNWSLPATWRDSDFYSLNYQLRYRPIYAGNYQHVKIDQTECLWLISDAMPNISYELQIRAKDEFDGQWSDWTSPVYAHTWTAPKTTVAPHNTTLWMDWEFTEGSGIPDNGKGVIEITPAADGNGVISMSVLCVVGVCLFLTIIILFVFLIRHRMAFITKKSQESVSSTSASSSTTPHLQQPLMTQKSNQGEGIHLHNVDYFFSSM